MCKTQSESVGAIEKYVYQNRIIDSKQNSTAGNIFRGLILYIYRILSSCEYMSCFYLGRSDGWKEFGYSRKRKERE